MTEIVPIYPTYGEMRSNAQKIEDAWVKERILRGIALLNEKYGPGWVDKVNPLVLDLASGFSCVLGQVYADAEPTEEQWEVYERRQGFRGGDGFAKGLAILDGDALDSPDAYGFDVDGDDYDELTENWLLVLTGERI